MKVKIAEVMERGFVITGIYSFRGKSKIEKILENIRSRPFVTVTKEE